MIKYLLVILVFLVQSSNVNCQISKYGYSKDDSNGIYVEYAKVAAYMTKRYMAPKTSTVAVTEYCGDICEKNFSYHDAILNDMLNDLYEDVTIQLFVGFYNDRLWDYNIFIADTNFAFTYSLFSFPSTLHERYFYFFILLTDASKNEAERYKLMYEIFELTLSFNVRNVVIMTTSFENNYIYFYTYDMFNEDNCRNDITIREINRYVNGSLQNDFLFPEYTSDFQGCVLNITAHEIPPLLTFNGDVNNETHLMESYRLNGIEGDILKMLAKELNFEIHLTFPQERSIIKKFNTSTGSFEQIDIDLAQIAIGGFSSTELNGRKYSSSYVYYTTPYVFVIRSGLSFVPVKQLLNPLSPSAWIFIFTFVMISFILAKIIQTKPKLNNFIFGSKNKKPISSLFAIFFGISIPTLIVPTRNFARFLLVSWLLLSFQLRNGYQGKMFDSLRFSQRIKLPQKISQLLEQDYTLLAANYTDYYPHNKTEIMRNVTKRLDEVQKGDFKFTSTALLDSLAHYNFINSKNSSLTYVQESILTFPCVMYFKKHSMLRQSVDKKLKAFSDAGITSYIAKQHVRSIFTNMNTNSQFVSRLANENLEGLYYIIGIMFGISIFVFILELLSSKCRRLKSIVDFLNSF